MSLVFTVDLVSVQCGKCGVTFGLPANFHRQCCEVGQHFYCPNGHCRVYGETEVKRLERELALEKSRHDQTKARLNTAEKAVATEKRKAARVQARVQNGVCPHCRRSFQNLRRHMQTKHKDKCTSHRS